MTVRPEVEEELRDYIQSLPEERRATRDRAARRQRLLPELRAHATRERQRVQRRRALARAVGLVALAGASAAAALWIALPRRTPGVATTAAARVSAASSLTVIEGALWLRGDTGARALRAGESVALADVGAFESPVDHTARVRISDVVAMTLAPASRARPMVTASAGSTTAGAAAPPALAIALERGRAHFEVQKLRGDRRFHVMTPDADVEVRGTTFDVALPPRADAPTCVSVDEGLVQVAKGVRTRLLARGDSWDCGAPDEADSAAHASHAVASSTTRAKLDHPRSIARGGRGADTARAAPSDLPMQNRIFQSALSAERAGRTDEAARRYRQLLARAPDGPLSPQARANLTAVTSARR